MKQSPREYWGEYLLFGVTIIPAMIATGFMPAWNVLPFGAWFAIASLGSGISGGIIARRWDRGLISGLICGLGIFLGIWCYAKMIDGGDMDLRRSGLGIAIGGLLGAGPGLLLLQTWATWETRDECEEVKIGGRPPRS